MPALIKAHPFAVSCLEVGQERYGPPLFAALATRSEPALYAFVYALSKDLLPGSCLDEIKVHYYEERQDQHLGRNFQFSNRRTVLSYLAELGRPVIVKLLLSMGNVDVDAKDSNGQTPLSRAAQNGREAVVNLLLSTDNVNIDAKDNNGQTPLSRAKEEMCLPESQGYQNPAHKDYLMQLMILEQQNKKRLLMARQDQYEAAHEAIIKLLLQIGKVDVNSRDKSGRTPLSWAAEKGNETMVKLLLESGKVDVDSKDITGQTPLFWAASGTRW
jgi:ankyrin repeat protein